jgi:hypothetical protein
MRRLLSLTAPALLAAVGTALAGPIGLSVTDDAGGTGLFSGIAGGTDQLYLGFGGADPAPPGLAAPADLPELIGGVVTHPPAEDGFPAPPLPPALPPAATPPPVAPIELIGAPAPTNPPDFIGGIVELGGASGGGSGAPASVTAVPLPLAIYGGLSLMLLPICRGVWRRARFTSAES